MSQTSAASAQFVLLKIEIVGVRKLRSWEVFRPPWSSCENIGNRVKNNRVRNNQES